MTFTISLAKDFTSTPGGRSRVMGPGSGEEFRAKLVREFKKHPNEVIEVILDGAEGYGSSFLEEAFGGLIRLRLLAPGEAASRLRIVALSPRYQTYVREARRYMEDATSRLSG